MQQGKQVAFRQYVLAGNRIVERERIAVSPHVYVDNSGEADPRNCFHAPGAGAKEPSGIQLKWAFLVLVAAVFIAFFMVGSKIALTERLEGEYAHLRTRYAAAEGERQKLLQDFSRKSDASSICYYAVQGLGMRLAGYEETIGVQAVKVPQVLQTAQFRGSASGVH